MLLNCLPKRLFSLELAIDPEPVEMQIPRMYLERYSLRLARLGMSEQGRFIVAEPKEPPSVISARNLVNAVLTLDARPVAICWDAMDLGFMRALSSEGIAYIRDERNAFLPFIGAVISDEVLGASPAAPLSSQSQRIVLNLIAGRWVDCSAGDLARLCGKSAASVSGYLSEIAAIAPGLIMRDGKKRILCDAGLSTETLLDGFEDYLRTPVLERIRLKKVIERTELRAVDALLSGMSALSYMSDLAHEDSAPTIALEKYQLEALKEHMGDKWLEAQWYEAAAVVIEVWSYPVDAPSDISFDATGLQCVDPFSLYVACAKADYKEDRLLDAVEQLRRTILHEEVIGAGATVYAESAEINARILLHGFQNVVYLIGQGLYRGTHQMSFSCASGKTKDSASCILIPVWCTETCERRNHVYAVCVRH